MLDFLPTITSETTGAEKLIELVRYLRPRQFGSTDHAEAQLHVLMAHLRQYPELRVSWRAYIVKLVSDQDQLQMYTETGILQATGFFTELSNRIKHKALPTLLMENDLRKLLQDVFYVETDYLWLSHIRPEVMREFFNLLGLFQPTEDRSTFKEQLINAVVIISHRITAMGLEREIRDRLVTVDELSSPFMTQSHEVLAYMDQLRTSSYLHTDSEDYKHILVLLNQCEECLLTLKSNKQKFGASLSLTFLMSRLQQNISRLRRLLALLHSSAENVSGLVGEFLVELVKADNLKNSIVRHLNDNIGLMAYQVVEHTGRAGEHYITNDRKEYFKFWIASLKGGFIVGFLAVFKFLLHFLHLAPFWQAFSYSINYAFGFVAIHVFHGALATKQPAMTASRIASSLDKRSSNSSLPDVVVMIAKVTRSQLISLMGNLMICFPMGVLLAWSWKFIFGEHLANPEEAMKLMHDVHPWQTYALWYAALTGIYLYLSGLISGYFDNLFIFKNIVQRLRIHKGLNRRMKPAHLEKLCVYLEHHVGAIAGNVSLGFMLGFTAFIGFIFGLPVDIRHITFSAASYGIGLTGVDFNVKAWDVFVSFLGIVGIGAMNFLFSFSFAFYTAMRSRGMAFSSSMSLVTALTRYFVKHPMEFFFPPAKEKDLPADDLL